MRAMLIPSRVRPSGRSYGFRGRLVYREPRIRASKGKRVASDKADLGIIGGSGLYEMDGFTDVREVAVETPFGSPSDAFVVGTLEGRRVAFLPRHGRGHRILPTRAQLPGQHLRDEGRWGWSGSSPSPRWAR